LHKITPYYHEKYSPQSKEIVSLLQKKLKEKKFAVTVTKHLFSNTIAIQTPNKAFNKAKVDVII